MFDIVMGLWRKFRGSHDGSVSIMFGLTASAIVGINVFAAEYSRAVNVRVDMQRKLDSALVHLSKGDRKYDPQTPGVEYMTKMVGTANYTLDEFDASFTWSDATATLTGTVDFQPKTIIAGGFFDGFGMTVRSSVSPKMLGAVEIALVLDSSGSMLFPIDDANSTTPAEAPNRRIDSLKAAVDKLFDSIYENPTVTPKVAVIPYANSVDVSQFYAHGSASDFTPTHGRSYNSLQLNYVTPYHTQHHSNTTLGPMRNKGLWATERYMGKNGDGSFNLSLTGPSAGGNMVPVNSQRFTDERCHKDYRYYFGARCILVARRWDGDDFRHRGYFFPHTGILAQTTDSQAVRNFVKDIAPRGGTAGHLGAAWGLYALAPSWHSVFQHPAGRPAALDKDEKHLVIMTDGQFNSPQTQGMSQADIFAYFQSVCDLAAASDVTVYTVGLLLQSKAMDTVLSNCVTVPQRYFKVDSHDDLVKAFGNIGRMTSQMRISM